jgi:hypothetical protein
VADSVHYRAQPGAFPAPGERLAWLGYTRRVGGGAVTYLVRPLPQLELAHGPDRRRGQPAARAIQRAMGIGGIFRASEQYNRLVDG